MSDPGPQPEPSIEPAEPLPGGPDSLADEEKYGATAEGAAVPDLDPEKNPAVEDTAPQEIKAPDDKQQEPDDEDPQADEEAGGVESPDDSEPTEPPA